MRSSLRRPHDPENTRGRAGRAPRGLQNACRGGRGGTRAGGARGGVVWGWGRGGVVREVFVLWEDRGGRGKREGRGRSGGRRGGGRPLRVSRERSCVSCARGVGLKRAQGQGTGRGGTGRPKGGEKCRHTARENKARGVETQKSRASWVAPCISTGGWARGGGGEAKAGGAHWTHSLAHFSDAKDVPENHVPVAR